MADVKESTHFNCFLSLLLFGTINIITTLVLLFMVRMTSMTSTQLLISSVQSKRCKATLISTYPPFSIVAGCSS